MLLERVQTPAWPNSNRRLGRPPVESCDGTDSVALLSEFGLALGHERVDRHGHRRADFVTAFEPFESWRRRPTPSCESDAGESTASPDDTGKTYSAEWSIKGLVDCGGKRSEAELVE